MKLKTSFFNTTAYQKNLTRFAPAWALYTIAGLLVTVTVFADSGMDYHYARSIGESLKFMSIINLGYALLAALLLFGDLFNSRMCNALHAMPMRREGWFVTNVLSGLTFSAAPNAVVALFMSVLMGDYWYIAFVWLLVATLQYIFFFGVAVFSAYCVGGRFAMTMVYGLVNFLALLAYFLVYTIYSPAMFGIEIEEDAFYFFSPAVQMTAYDYVALASDGVRDSIPVIQWANMLYPAACALLGVAFMAVGLLLYRRRELECAGDFVTVKPLVPVFLVLYTLCAGAVLYLFDEVFAGGAAMLFMLIGLVCGFFTGKMLLERTVRVFNKRSAIGLGLFLLAFVLSMLLARIDPLGVTRWVPDANSVKQVEISNYYGNGEGMSLTQQADIDAIRKVHQHGVRNRHEGDDGVQDVRITLTYTLKSGYEASRSYYINTDTEAGEILRSLMSRPEYVLGTTEAELKTFVRNIHYFEFSHGEPLTDPKKIEGLMLALIRDCEEGRMAQRSGFHADEETVCWFYYYHETRLGKYETKSVYRDISVYSGCTNTIAWLEENGYVLDEEFGLVIPSEEDVKVGESMPVIQEVT